MQHEALGGRVEGLEARVGQAEQRGKELAGRLERVDERHAQEFRHAEQQQGAQVRREGAGGDGRAPRAGAGRTAGTVGRCGVASAPASRTSAWGPCRAPATSLPRPWGPDPLCPPRRHVCTHLQALTVRTLEQQVSRLQAEQLATHGLAGVLRRDLDELAGDVRQLRLADKVSVGAAAGCGAVALQLRSS